MISVRTKNILMAKEKIIVVDANSHSIEDTQVNNIIRQQYPHIGRECLNIIQNTNEDLVGNVKFVDCQSHIAAILFTHRYPQERTNIYAYIKCIDYLFSYCARNKLSVAMPYHFWSNNMDKDELRGYKKIISATTRELQQIYNIDLSFYR